MAKHETRTYYDSEAILAQMVLPAQTNPAGNIHGGEIMKLMDSTAGVSAMKHARTGVVTARVDEIQFKHPIHVGEHVTCTAHVVYAGHSSMEVFVTVESENLYTGAVKVAQTAFFTMVAIDQFGKPTAVPPLEFSNEPFVRALYFEGQRRYDAHRNKGRRKGE